MSDPELEAELRALRPAPPSTRLERAIAQELATPSRILATRPASGIIRRSRPRAPFRFWPSFGWAAAGALAAVLAVSLLPARWSQQAGQPALASETPLFEPVTSAREIVSTESGEVSYDGEEGPTQLVRYSSVERQTWSNPATGALLEVEMPREDILIVPIAYQ